MFAPPPPSALSAAKADWTPLHGRTVVIWPDNDGPGANYAADVARLVPGAKIVPVPASFPDRWDLADALPEGITLEALGGLLLLAEAPKVKAKKPKQGMTCARPLKRQSVSATASLPRSAVLISKTVANGAHRGRGRQRIQQSAAAHGGAQHSRG